MRAFICAGVLALAGCAAVPPQSDESASPIALRARDAVDPAFSLSGRFVVKGPDQTGSAALDWTHSTRHDELQVNGPLGKVLAQLVRDERGVRLIDERQRVTEAASLDALSRAVFGMELPLSPRRGLGDWACRQCGRPRTRRGRAHRGAVRAQLAGRIHRIRRRRPGGAAAPDRRQRRRIQLPAAHRRVVSTAMSALQAVAVEWGVWLPAPAKINLFLHVVGRRADGYHLLQTAFRFLDHGDRLRFTPRADGRVHRLNDVPGVPEDDDLVVRAARLLQRETGCTQGADIEVDKRLPMGGGLGGGSSDAATVLIALNRLWQLGLSRARLQEIGLTLGADVPVFVFGRSAFAEGVGERLQPLQLPPAAYLVVAPGVSVPTHGFLPIRI
jgi:hypothetical protein